MNNQIELGFSKLEAALEALEVAINEPMHKSRINIDASIQRFEFTFELLWKLLKKIMETQGIQSTFPKDVLSKAYQNNLINDEKTWLKMLEDRNETSHTYNKILADQIYADIKQYYPTLKSTFDDLSKKYRPQ